MFIGELSKEKQVSFLNLAYTMMYIDDNLAEKEKKIFESYAAEVSVDIKMAHKVNFEDELKAFDESNKSEKKKVFFELYAIALIDEVFEERENNLINIVKARFCITDDEMREMKEGLDNLNKAYKKLSEIVNA